MRHLAPETGDVMPSGGQERLTCFGEHHHVTTYSLTLP